MEKFSSFITEQKEEPYRLCLIIYDDPLDPNKTGEEIKKEWAVSSTNVLMHAAIEAAS